MYYRRSYWGNKQRQVHAGVHNPPTQAKNGCQWTRNFCDQGLMLLACGPAASINNRFAVICQACVGIPQQLDNQPLAQTK